MKTSELRSTITAAGLTCPSCHFTFGELTDKLDDRIEFAKTARAFSNDLLQLLAARHGYHKGLFGGVG